MGGSLGNKPCGRVLLGPFSWVHMGELSTQGCCPDKSLTRRVAGVNTDLNPENKTAWGAVWLRTNATKLSTVFATAPSSADLQAPPPAPTMAVEVLASDDLSVASVHPCAPAETAQHASATVLCDLVAMGISTGDVIGLRFLGSKLEPKEGGWGLASSEFN